jgi:CRISPR-associated protein Csb2
VAECARRSLPHPEVEVLEYSPTPGGGNLRVRARLRFANSVLGPVLLGQESHRGGGLFAVSAGAESEI